MCVWGGIRLRFESPMITTGLVEQIVQSLTLCPVGSCLFILNVILFGRGCVPVGTLGRLRSGVIVRGLNVAELRASLKSSCKVRCEGVLADWTGRGRDFMLFEVASEWDCILGQFPLLCPIIILLCLATSLGLSAVPEPVRFCDWGRCLVESK